VALSRWILRGGRVACRWRSAVEGVVSHVGSAAAGRPGRAHRRPVARDGRLAVRAAARPGWALTDIAGILAGGGTRIREIATLGEQEELFAWSPRSRRRGGAAGDVLWGQAGVLTGTGHLASIVWHALVPGCWLGGDTCVVFGCDRRTEVPGVATLSSRSSAPRPWARRRRSGSLPRRSRARGSGAGSSPSATCVRPCRGSATGRRWLRLPARRRVPRAAAAVVRRRTRHRRRPRPCRGLLVLDRRDPPRGPLRQLRHAEPPALILARRHTLTRSAWWAPWRTEGRVARRRR